jgi:hypothetical protein
MDFKFGFVHLSTIVFLTLGKDSFSFFFKYVQLYLVVVHKKSGSISNV